MHRFILRRSLDAMMKTPGIGGPATPRALSLQSPPQELLSPLRVPTRLLLGPGPSNSSARVRAAGALPLLGHLHPEFCQVMDEVRAGLRYAFQTRNAVTLAVSGTGHAAMEAAIVNLVQEGERVAVCVHGVWGERAASIARRLRADVRTLEGPAGERFSIAQIEQALLEHRPRLLFVTHGESSTGVLQPLEGIGPLCHRSDCLLVVDSVASLGGTPLHMDGLEIDVLYTGSQKVLGCPPGPSPISFSQRAWERLLARKTEVPSFYFDMKGLANYWGCDEGPRRYHHTGPISAVYALREGLAELVEEGLERCWERHRRNALRLHRGLAELGLQLFVGEKEARLPTITTVRVPPGYAWKEVVDFIMSRHGIEIAGGLGPTAGQVWRIGLMGPNSTEQNVDKVLLALRDALATCSRSKL
ncbi:alanine--glyoxylate aminotransferase [Petromyzon marinus]|uniref:Alanine--glyoxylate aminotransferase n=2 Tax=Petromyzon marinus TaxID=7757 RepID=A0AAJ7TJG8_PETMA|nr:serine--pyruvate aminotransferase [Petromyzon marinus]